MFKFRPQSHRSLIWSIFLVWGSRKNLDWAGYGGLGYWMRWRIETSSAKGISAWVALTGNFHRGERVELTICRHTIEAKHGNRSVKVWDQWKISGQFDTYIILCVHFMFWNHILYYVVSSFKSSSSNIANNLSTFTSAYKVHPSECFPRQQLRWSVYQSVKQLSRKDGCWKEKKEANEICRATENPRVPVDYRGRLSWWYLFLLKLFSEPGPSGSLSSWPSLKPSKEVEREETKERVRSRTQVSGSLRYSRLGSRDP